MHFQPIRKNDDARFVPVVLVHDREANGEQMMARLRSIAWQRLQFNALLVCPTFTGAYAFLQNGTGYGPGADQQLLDALAHQTEVGKTTDRMLVFGFGDGAQFAHRFALQHPRRVAGCVALSGDSWTDPHGFCTGPMIKAGGFDEPPFDTDAVQAARKTACAEPTALPGVRWLVGASSDAPEHQAAAEQFRGDLSRADSSAESLAWEGEPHRVPTPQMMTALRFFNDVVAQPAALPPAPPQPVEPAPVEASEPEGGAASPPPAADPNQSADAAPDAEAETPSVAEAAPQAPTEAQTEAAKPAEPAVETPTEPVVEDAARDASAEPGPDDSDAPMTHGRVDTAPTLTARERARLAPKPKAPAPKPGEGNGFFDQLLRQQSPPPDADGDASGG